MRGAVALLNERSYQLRVQPRRRKQPEDWLLDVLELFREKGQLTARQLALAAGKSSGGEAITCCRQIGLPIKAIGKVAGGNNKVSVYTLDLVELWSALEKSVQQQGRYARLLGYLDNRSRRLVFPGPAAWIAHLRRVESGGESK